MSIICGIIGHPLAQTLSPVLHNAGFAELGIDGCYQVWPTPPEELSHFIERVRRENLTGVSITIPHKETVIPLLDDLTEEAESVGAVNTLFWRHHRLVGHNTDLEGFLRPLSTFPLPAEARILGSGGAARAAAAGLLRLGVARVRIAARSGDKARAMAADLGCETLDWNRRSEASGSASLVVVNTTPLGMTGKNTSASALSTEDFTAMQGDAQSLLAYDLVYNPLCTRFLQEAKLAGWSVQDGLEMFLGQAVAQFRLWTGREFDLSAGRKRLMQELAP